MKRTLIISAFPACGKTYLYQNQDVLLFTNIYEQRIHYSFIDIDSSKFKKENDWERKYVDSIEENMGKVDFILICQHDEVLYELSLRDIPFITVAPCNEPWSDPKNNMIVKQQWFGRIILRDNSHIHDLNTWLKKLSENYDKWTSVDNLTKYYPVSFFTLNANQYLGDIIEDLYWKKETFDSYVSNQQILI